MTKNAGRKIPLDVQLHGHLVDLKPTGESDYPALQKILSDPKTMNQLQYMAHLEEGGWTLEQVRERYEKWAEGQKAQTNLNFTIHVKTTDEVGGTCGFKHIDLLHRKAEYGIILYHPFWNAGVSLECALLCLDYAFTDLQLHRITFETLTTNKRAEAFLKKLGTHLECTQKESFFENGKFQDNGIYVLFEKDWPGVKQKLQEKLGRQRTRVK
ncbi:MAG: GNAT family N-acetyltransferase [Deltaproteobacteria bacterium]|nr:GNAT family N-acetyltransferase [Deltaproteobacteria bacterium]